MPLTLQVHLDPLDDLSTVPTCSLTFPAAITLTEKDCDELSQLMANLACKSFMFADLADLEGVLGRAWVRLGGVRYGLSLDRHRG